MTRRWWEELDSPSSPSSPSSACGAWYNEDACSAWGEEEKRNSAWEEEEKKNSAWEEEEKEKKHGAWRLGDGMPGGAGAPTASLCGYRSADEEAESLPVYAGERGPLYFCCPRPWCNFCAVDKDKAHGITRDLGYCYACFVREQGPNEQGIFLGQNSSFKRACIFTLGHLNKRVRIRLRRPGTGESTAEIEEGYGGTTETYRIGKKVADKLRATYGDTTLEGVLSEADEHHVVIGQYRLGVNPPIYIMQHDVPSDGVLPRKPKPPEPAPIPEELRGRRQHVYDRLANSHPNSVFWDRMPDEFAQVIPMGVVAQRKKAKAPQPSRTVDDAVDDVDDPRVANLLGDFKASLPPRDIPMEDLPRDIPLEDLGREAMAESDDPDVLGDIVAGLTEDDLLSTVPPSSSSTSQRPRRTTGTTPVYTAPASDDEREDEEEEDEGEEDEDGNDPNWSVHEDHAQRPVVDDPEELREQREHDRELQRLVAMEEEEKQRREAEARDREAAPIVDWETRRDRAFARRNGLPEDIIFPEGFDTMSVKEQGRLINMYNNAVHLAQMNLENGPMRNFNFLRSDSPEALQGGAGRSTTATATATAATTADKRRQREETKERLRQRKEEERQQKIERQQEEARIRREEAKKRPPKRKSPEETLGREYHQVGDVPWQAFEELKHAKGISWRDLPAVLRDDVRIQRGLALMSDGGPEDFVGVSRVGNGGMWLAKATIHKQLKDLGRYPEAKVAALVYLAVKSLDERIDRGYGWLTWIATVPGAAEAWLSGLPADAQLPFVELTDRRGRKRRGPAASTSTAPAASTSAAPAASTSALPLDDTPPLPLPDEGRAAQDDMLNELLESAGLQPDAQQQIDDFYVPMDEDGIGELGDDDLSLLP